MSTGIFHSLFPDHCGSYGPGCHILSINGVFGLAHLNHTNQVGLATFTSDIVDHFLAGEPTVHEQIVEAKMFNGRIVEHILHTGYLILEVLLLAFFHLGLSIALFIESSINVLLGKALGPGRHPSFLSQQGEVIEHLCASIGTAEEESFVAEDTSAIFHVRVYAPKHFAFTSGLRHIGIIDNHTNGIFGISSIGAQGNVLSKLLVDIAENMAPVNPVIGKNAIEHIFPAIKERLKGASKIVRSILDEEEWKENHHLDHLSTSKFTVGFLFESHLFSVMFMVPSTFIILCMPSPQPFSVKKLRNSETICLFLFMLDIYFCLSTLIY